MKVLAFFAHPDDETMFAGGTLALLAKRGAEVHYLCATRGEGGETGQPPRCSIEELGKVREQELACAVGKLRGKSLTFLGYEDPRVGPGDELYPFTGDLTALAGQVAATVLQFEIDVILTHGSNGEYGHPAHVLCHQAALAAAMSARNGEQPAAAAAMSARNGEQPAVYTFSAAFEGHPYPRLLNRDDPAAVVLDISEVLEQKTDAAYCHQTQHALFVRRRSELAGRQLEVHEVIVPVESVGRALNRNMRFESLLSA